MPIGEAFVGHVAEAFWVQRIADIHDDPVARARARGDVLGREDGDVVALVGDARFLRAVPVIATAPEPGDIIPFREDTRAADEAGLAGIGHRNLDHVDTEQGRRIAPILETARQLLVGPDVGRARIVDHDAAIVRRNDRVGMAATASLHRPHLARRGQIRDVEDAQTAHALVADTALDATEAAIEPRPAVLHAHQKEVAHDRDVALPARTDGGADEVRHAVRTEAVDVEAVIAARDQQIVLERHIGGPEGQQRSALAETRFLLLAFEDFLPILAIGAGFGVGLALVLDQRLELGGIAGIEETGRLGHGSEEAHVRNRLARVAEARRQRGARIVRQAREQGVHAADLGVLVVHNLIREFEHGRLVGGAGRTVQRLHHRHRTLVVLHHQIEEHPVEGSAR